MTAYRLRAFESADRELERLRSQVRAGLSVEAPVYEAHGLLEAGDVVDVGAGSGEPARWMQRAGLRVTCVDLDPHILAHAPTDARRLVARADALPFPNATFGGAFTRFLLQHVPDPQAVVSEMARVVRPGGLVLAMDTDVRSFVSHPEIPTGEEARRAWVEHARANGADPHVGVRLRSLFVGSGCTDVRTSVLTVTSDTVGRETFADVALSPHARVVFRGDPERLDRAERELGAWIAEEGAFGSVTLFVTSGRAP